MEQTFSVIHVVFLILLLPLAAAAFILKMILVFGKKGFFVPAYIGSFFRIYRRRERDGIRSKSWKRYMAYNNYINYYLYFCIVIFILMFLAYQKDVFHFSS